LKPVTCLDTLTFAAKVLDAIMPFSHGSRRDEEDHVPAYLEESGTRLLESDTDGIEEMNTESICSNEGCRPLSSFRGGDPDVPKEAPVAPQRLRGHKRGMVFALSSLIHLVFIVALVVIPLCVYIGRIQHSHSPISNSSTKTAKLNPDDIGSDGAVDGEMGIVSHRRLPQHIEPYIIRHSIDVMTFPPFFEIVEWLEVQGSISLENLAECFRRVAFNLKKLVLNVDAVCGEESPTALQSQASNRTFVFERLNAIVIQNVNKCRIFPWRISIRSKVLEEVTLLKSKVVGESYESFCTLMAEHRNSIKELTIQQSSISPSFALFAKGLPNMHVKYSK